MPAEQAEPEQLDPLSILGRVDPPRPEVLERARRRLRSEVAAEAPPAEAPRHPRGRGPHAPPDTRTSPDTTRTSPDTTRTSTDNNGARCDAGP
jgi:hypothetical protein